MTDRGSARAYGEPAEGRFGLHAGIVEQNVDDRGRVRVRLEWIDARHVTEWAKVAQIYAGDGFGAYWIPEVGDQVVVAFLDGDLRDPVVVGSLYSQAAVPHAVRTKKADPKYFRTRGGHLLMMEDAEGRRIELVDLTGKNRVLIDTEANSIAIEAEADVTVDAGRNLSATAGGDATVEAAGNATLKGGGSVTVEAGGSLTLKAASITIEAPAGAVTVTGASISLN